MSIPGHGVISRCGQNSSLTLKKLSHDQTIQILKNNIKEEERSKSSIYQSFDTQMSFKNARPYSGLQYQNNELKTLESKTVKNNFGEVDVNSSFLRIKADKVQNNSV